MSGKLLQIFMWCLMFGSQYVTCMNSIYFHKPSILLIQPNDDVQGTEFGHALGFQSRPNQLVVGAPARGNGKVFTCDMNYYTDTVDVMKCNETIIPIETLAPPTEIEGSVQGFYTGSSIATTSDYFFTCAPLWTSSLNYTYSEGSETIAVSQKDAYGTCFTCYNNNTCVRYEGAFEKTENGHLASKLNQKLIANLLSGGTGWVTLADQDNDLLLLLQTSINFDFSLSKLSKSHVSMKSTKLEMKGVVDLVTVMTNLRRRHIYSIVAGAFFSKKTIYAVSLETEDMMGIIIFLEYNSGRLKLFKNTVNYYRIMYHSPGTLFGTALGAAQLDSDEYSDILVGVPGYLDRDCLECGALFVYLGEFMPKKKYVSQLETQANLQILGIEVRSRFGSTIATSDMDDDGKPEIIVSAIYEDDGSGALYIFSGYEIEEILEKSKLDGKITMAISDFTKTQKIKMEYFKTLGFSLQLVSDLDHNGCDELAVGAPGNDSVVLMKCVRAINVTIEAKKLGDDKKTKFYTIGETETSFTIEVCATVAYPPNQENVTGVLIFNNKIVDLRGASQITSNRMYEEDFICQDCIEANETSRFCHNVTIDTDDKPNEIDFTTTVYLDTQFINDEDAIDFNPSWVVASIHSRLSDSIKVTRPQCDGDNCRPRLNITEFYWVGHENESDLSYVIGSSSNEKFTVVVENEGGSTLEACVLFNVIGARQGIEQYNVTSYLKRMSRNESKTVTLDLELKNPTSRFSELLIIANAREDCSEELVQDNSRLKIAYIHPINDIVITGSPHSQEIENSGHKWFEDTHEYTITNNGNVTWENITADVIIEKNAGLDNFTMQSNVCAFNKNGDLNGNSNETFITDSCTLLKLRPKSSEKIRITTKLIVSEIAKQNGLNLTSMFILHLKPTAEVKTKNITISFTYVQPALSPLYIGLIAAITALIILAIIVYVLYRFGFFKRKEKLLEAKASIRKRSIKQSTRSHSKADGEGLEMEVADDPFDDLETIEDIEEMAENVNDSEVLIHDEIKLHS